MALLSVEGISRREKTAVTVDHISFSLEPLQKIAIAGATGSGKTSLLKMISGLLQPSSGSIYFEDKKVLGPEEKLMPGHPHVAYLSQHFELRNNYRVEDELDAKNTLASEDAARIYSVCRIEHLLKRMTNQLSGGEKQRIAMARVLISSPRLLCLDEPYSNLDMRHKKIISDVVSHIASDLQITVLMVLHDATDILSWADRILVMQEGKIIQQGAPSNIYKHPVNEYCASLFGAYNLMDPSIFGGDKKEPSPEAKKLFLRPEDIHIVGAEASSIVGIVEHVSFRGSHFLLNIKIMYATVVVQVNKNAYVKGDKVHLSISSEDSWFV